MKKKQVDPMDEILERIGRELDALPPPKPPPERIELGWVAIQKKTKKATSGAYYSAGAKVYKTEAVARAATRRHDQKNLIFAKAFAEIEPFTEWLDKEDQKEEKEIRKWTVPIKPQKVAPEKRMRFQATKKAKVADDDEDYDYFQELAEQSEDDC